MTRILSQIEKLGRNAAWRLVPGFVRRRLFRDSRSYWEKRYETGGRSGPGSAGALAAFKAEVLNEFVRENAVLSVVEFGCGDGSQLALAQYPEYTGVDVSEKALSLCRTRFAGDASKHFASLDSSAALRAELALSLDVVYHLVEDEVFEAHLRALFAAASRFVIVYSSDSDDNRDIQGPHIRHRAFTRWIAANEPGWRLLRRIPNRIPYDGSGIHSSFADFFVFGKTGAKEPGAETRAL